MYFTTGMYHLSLGDFIPDKVYIVDAYISEWYISVDVVNVYFRSRLCNIGSG